MYNQDKKESFINEYLKSKVIAATSLYAILKKTEPFEIKYREDASEFTKDEILYMFKEFKAKSVNSLLNYGVVLKHYSRFVKNEVGSNAYELLEKSDIVGLIDKDAKILLTREDVDDIEIQLLNWADKAIVELLWEGVSGKSMEDIFSVSEECIQGEVLKVNGKEYLMTDRLKELLPKAFAEEETMSYGESRKIIQVNGKGRIYKERSNTLGIDSGDAKFRYFYRRIQMFRDYLDIPGLTMKNIAASGLWHYLQLGMEERNLGLRDFLKTKQGERLAKKYGFGNYWVDNIYSKYEQYI